MRSMHQLSVPRAIGGFVDPFVLGEVVAVGSQAIERAIASRDALEEVCREKTAFGLYGGEEVSGRHWK